MLENRKKIIIEVIGEGDIPKFFRSEFEYFLNDKSDDPDVRFIFDDKEQQKSGFITGTSYKNENCFKYTIENSANVVITKKNNIYEVYVDIIPSFKKKIGKIIPFVYKFANIKYASVQDMMYQQFIWDVFQPVSQLIFINKGMSYIHGSSLTDEDGNSYVFTGWGGSGKTSTSSFMMLNNIEKYKFLADDLSIIDSQGQLYFNPMSIHLYPYNTPNFPLLKQKIEENQEGILDNLQWNLRNRLFGVKGVCRRYSPKQIYDNHIAETGKVRKVFYFQRYTGDTLVVEKVDNHRMGQLTSNVMYYEIKHWTDVLSTYNCTGVDSNVILPTLNEFICKTESNLREAFVSSDNYLIKVPNNCQPGSLYGKIKELL